MYEELMIDGEEQCEVKLCHECQEQSYAGDCEKECRKMVRRHVNETIVGDIEWIYQGCLEERDRWQPMLNQGPDGQFSKYDKVNEHLHKAKCILGVDCSR